MPFGGFQNPAGTLPESIDKTSQIILQAVSDWNKQRDEAAGHRLILDDALKNNVINQQQYADIIKSPVAKQNAMVGSVMALTGLQQKRDADQRAQQALQLQQGEYQRRAYEWLETNRQAQEQRDYERKFAPTVGGADVPVPGAQPGTPVDGAGAPGAIPPWPQSNTQLNISPFVPPDTGQTDTSATAPAQGAGAQTAAPPSPPTEHYTFIKKSPRGDYDIIPPPFVGSNTAQPITLPGQTNPVAYSYPTSRSSVSLQNLPPAPDWSNMNRAGVVPLQTGPSSIQYAPTVGPPTPTTVNPMQITGTNVAIPNTYLVQGEDGKPQIYQAPPQGRSIADIENTFKTLGIDPRNALDPNQLHGFDANNKAVDWSKNPVQFRIGAKNTGPMYSFEQVQNLRAMATSALGPVTVGKSGPSRVGLQGGGQQPGTTPQIGAPGPPQGAPGTGTTTGATGGTAAPAINQQGSINGQAVYWNGTGWLPMNP